MDSNISTDSNNIHGLRNYKICFKITLYFFRVPFSSKFHTAHYFDPLCSCLLMAGQPAAAVVQRASARSLAQQQRAGQLNVNKADNWHQSATSSTPRR
jgi:hypothetical protein